MDNNTKEKTAKDVATEDTKPETEQVSVGMEGRRFPKSTPNSPQHEELIEIQNQTEEENSVSQDLNIFKKYVKNLTGKVSDKVEPIAKAGLEKSKQGFKKSKQAISKTKSDVEVHGRKKPMDFSIIKKLMGIFLVILLLIIIGIVGIGFYVKSQQPTGPRPTVAPSPTPPSYQSYRPSVYAKDPEVLNIEQTLDILNREMDTTTLNEDELLPPKLDFSVSFK